MWAYWFNKKDTKRLGEKVKDHEDWQAVRLYYKWLDSNNAEKKI